VSLGKRRDIDESSLIKFLRMAHEQDWIEFKGELKLFSNDKIVDRARDEFLKDILGLANGNSQTIRKTKYMIIGADDKKFDENRERVRHNVDYRVPTASEIAKWLSKACSPAVVGLECYEVIYKGECLYVIIIPPTFDLHETTRELNGSSKFNEHTVFMRHNEHIFPASERDRTTILQLKHLFRHEVTNPTSTWLGAIVGAIVSFILGGAIITSDPEVTSSSMFVLKIVLSILGAIIGLGLGFFMKEFNLLRYDYRYMKFRNKLIFMAVVIGIVMIGYTVQIYLVNR
jgi:hypothetical protein